MITTKPYINMAKPSNTRPLKKILCANVNSMFPPALSVFLSCPTFIVHTLIGVCHYFFSAFHAFLVRFMIFTRKVLKRLEKKTSFFLPSRAREVHPYIAMGKLRVFWSICSPGNAFFPLAVITDLPSA